MHSRTGLGAGSRNWIRVQAEVQARKIRFPYRLRCRLQKFYSSTRSGAGSINGFACRRRRRLDNLDSRTGLGACSRNWIQVQAEVQGREITFAYRLRCRLEKLNSSTRSGAGSEKSDSRTGSDADSRNCIRLKAQSQGASLNRVQVHRLVARLD